MDVFLLFLDQYLKYLKEEGNILKFEFSKLLAFAMNLMFIKGMRPDI